MSSKPWLALALVGALAGFGFAAVSTYDFEQHLDRQVHDVHCSFVPGVSESEAGSSGCETTLMSPYSSVFRTWVWGGIPVSLPAMSVFAFLLFFGADLAVAGRDEDLRATGFYLAATLLPVGASIVMAYISFDVLDAACKLCIGIYVSSALAFVGAAGLVGRQLVGGSSDYGSLDDPYGEDPEWALEAEADDQDEADGDDQDEMGFDDPLDDEVTWDDATGDGDGPIGWGKLAGAFALGCLFVAVPTIGYVSTVPDHGQFVGNCGQLEEQPDSELLVDLGGGDAADAVPALEIFDPLCPACRGFEKHLDKTKFARKLDRRAVLFPLDDSCNWMIDTAVHPGACTVSKAVLCADRPARVVDWAFDQQEAIRKAAKESDGAAREMVGDQFPDLASCVDSPETKARLNRSLRWAVRNELKVLTPQFYVDGVRLCDEDVDLGLEFALQEMVDRYEKGTLQASAGSSEGDSSDDRGD